MMSSNLVDSAGSDVLDTLLHYGLFVGAIFQLVCIFAVILVPAKEEEPVSGVYSASGGPRVDKLYIASLFSVVYNPNHRSQ